MAFRLRALAWCWSGASLLALMLLAESVTWASKAEDEAIAFIKRLGGKVERDDKAPGKPIVKVNLANSVVMDTELKLLASLKDLHTLSLYDIWVTGTELNDLPPFKNLHTLSISRLTDKSLKVLTKLGLLHTLGTAEDKKRPKGPEEVVSLSLGSKVTDAGLKELAILKNLHTLDLRGTEVTGAGLQALAPFKKLHTLNLSNHQVTDRTLQVLRQIGLLHVLEQAQSEEGKRPKGPEEVVSLHLSATPVTDAGLKELVHFKKLHTLNLSNHQVTDAGLKELAHFKKLHTLSLPFQVTGEGIKNLHSLKNLRCLILYKPQNTNAVLQELEPFKKLHTLALEDSEVTDRTLQLLRQAGLLHALIQANTRDGNRPKSPEEVEFLDLKNTLVTDAGLKELVPLKNLGALNLEGTRITDTGLKEMAAFKNLQELYLSWTQATTAGVKELQKALPKCKIFK